MRKLFPALFLLFLLAACSNPAGNNTTPTSSIPPTITPFPDPKINLYSNANYINSVTVDQNGDVWGVGNGGCVRWDASTGNYQKFTVNEGMPSQIGQKVITAPDGAVWVDWNLTHVSRFHNEVWEHFNIGTNLFVGSDGRIWVSQFDKLHNFLNSQWFTYDLNEILGESRFYNTHSDFDGNIWVTLDKSVARLKNDKWTIWEDIDVVTDRSSSNIFFTKDGLVWVETFEGITIFNGEEWTNYTDTQYGNIVDVLWEEEKGFYWFACDRRDKGYYPDPENTVSASSFGGVYRFDGETWTHYNTLVKAKDFGLPGYDDKDQLLGNSVKSILKDYDGNLWIGTNPGIGFYNSREDYWEPLIGEKPLGHVGEINLASNGSIINATDNGVLDITLEGIINGSPVVVFIKTCVGDTYLTGLGPFSPEEMESPPCHEGIYRDENVSYGPDGTLYIPNYGHGVVVPEESGLRIYETNDVLPITITELAVDHEGRVWFDGELGLMSFDGNDIKYHAEDSQALSSDIWDIAVGPDGRVWVSYSQGVSVWDGSSWIHWIPTIDRYFYEKIGAYVFAFHGDDVWMGNGRGLYKLPEGKLSKDIEWITFDLERLGGLRRGVTSLAIDQQGGIWASTSFSRVTYYNGDNWIPYLEEIEESEFSHSKGVSLLTAAPDGIIWAYTQPYGLVQINQEGWNPFDLSEYLPQLGSKEIINDILFTSDGVSWFATKRGLVRNEGSDWRLFNSLNSGIPCDIITKIAEGPGGELWLSVQDCGLVRFEIPR